MEPVASARRARMEFAAKATIAAVVSAPRRRAGGMGGAGVR